MASPPDNAVTRGASDLYNGAKGFGSDIANSAWVREAKNFFKDPSAWGMGGAGLMGILAWFIGNAFGGGGILGTVLTVMLMPMFLQIGKNWGEGSLKSAFTGSPIRRDDYTGRRLGVAYEPPARGKSEGTARLVSLPMADEGLAEAAAEYRRNGGRELPPDDDTSYRPPHRLNDTRTRSLS